MRLIANPAAGGGQVGRDWDRIVETLAAVFPGIDAVQTERIGHGRDLATVAVAEGHTELLSMGGDGTHSEVAAGIAASGAEPGAIGLGILHGGTGGDFSRLLGRGTLVEQATRLRDEPDARVDLAKVVYDGGERVFLNEVSFGMSATICTEVNRSSKRLGGKLTFLTQTLKVALTYQAQPVEIVVDGRVLKPGPIQTVLVCNGQWAGGGMHFAPRSRLADGALDVTVIRDLPTLRAVRTTPRLYDGTVLEQDHVTAERGAKIAIRSLGEPLWIEADGEVVGQTPATVEVLPGALRLLGAPTRYL